MTTTVLIKHSKGYFWIPEFPLFVVITCSVSDWAVFTSKAAQYQKSRFLYYISLSH